MFYWIVIAIVNFISRVCFNIKYIGKENVPKTEGAILAVNHRSNWDVILAASASPRKLRFMAKSELFKNKLFGGLIKKLGAFPVQRGKGDIGAIKSALGILNKKEIMLMFPEGRRIRKGEHEVTDAKAGVAMLATRAKVDIIPVYISGQYKFRHKITVVIGEPIKYDDYYDQKLNMETLQNLSNDVLKQMRKLKI